MGLRASIEKWFDAHDLRPRVVGEFEDSTLMEVAASGTPAFTAVHSAVSTEAVKHYGLRVIAEAQDCGTEFYAITTQRRVKHPAAVAITQHAHTHLFA